MDAYNEAREELGKARIARLTEANRELRRQRDDALECLRDLVDACVDVENLTLDDVLKRASELLAGG